MSSSTYSSCLLPDPDLRLLVEVSARLLIAAGIVVSLTISLATLLKLCLALACLAVGRLELSNLQRGHRGCREIRLHSDGSALILGELDWTRARLESGSVVLNQLAWLRLRTSEGTLVTELLRGDARQCREWRRLQVIWRHI